VRPGENLFRIGKAYDVDYRELARDNGISNPDRIEVGQSIFISGATRQLPVEMITPRATEVLPRPGEVAAPPPVEPVVVRGVPAGPSGMIWPTSSGSLSSRYGPRNGSFHDGIDVSAPQGTPVYAARAGRVIYSDRIPGYGNIVIVDHGRGLTTVYAHNSENGVAEGAFVARGQQIARVGSSGRTTGPNLHFEVRQGNVAHDPLRYLPSLLTTRR
jgi:lipoprotein NlpD